MGNIKWLAECPLPPFKTVVFQILIKFNSIDMQNRRDCSKFNVCSQLKNCNGLTRKWNKIYHYYPTNTQSWHLWSL